MEKNIAGYKSRESVVDLSSQATAYLDKVKDLDKQNSEIELKNGCKQWSEVSFYEGQGCIECAGTGFRGRTAIHELLDLSDRIREMILAKKPTSEIRRAAREEGMRFLRESALDKVRAGTTTLKEINKVTFIESTR